VDVGQVQHGLLVQAVEFGTKAGDFWRLGQELTLEQKENNVSI
jgi:hypothetical protein